MTITIDLEIMHIKERIAAEPLAALYQYWEEKKGSGKILRRDHFDPVDVPDLLSHLILLDVVDGGKNFHYRLVGTHIVTAIGRDFTGETVIQFHKGHEDISVIDGYFAVLEAGEPQLENRSLQNIGRDYITYERLLLPMSRSNGPTDSVLAGFQFHLPVKVSPMSHSRIA